MKRILVLCVSLFFLAACGGGGGGDAGVIWPSDPVQPGQVVSAALASGDETAPDGSYVDLYRFDLATDTTVDCRLSSPDFDAYLVLLNSSVLHEPDKNNWNLYVLDVNDDQDSTTSDSRLSLQLAAGQYVLVATSFYPAETGSYQLSLATDAVSVTGISYLQSRTYEDPARDHHRAWVDLLNNGAPIRAVDIQSVEIFDVNGMPFAPASPPQFIASTYIIAGWNPASGRFENVTAGGHSGFFFNLSNHQSITPGPWTIQVLTAGGTNVISQLNFPGMLSLLPVASASMSPQWNPDGSLTLAWDAPADGFEQYRVYFSDAAGNDLLYARVPAGITSVTLDPAMIQAIEQINGLGGPISINWQMQTRSYDGSNNYARSVSDPVVIPWP